MILSEINITKAKSTRKNDYKVKHTSALVLQVLFSLIRIILHADINIPALD